VISLTDLFAAALQRHNDVILLPAIHRVSVNDFVFHQDSASTHRAAHVQQLTVAPETPDFLAPNLWPPNSPDLNPVDYEIWAVIRHRVYHRQIYSVDELKRQLIDVSCGLEQSIFDEAIDQWRGRHRTYVRAKGGHFEYSLWTDNVDFVHVCYIQCDLVWLLHLFLRNHASNVGQYILQGSGLADLRYGGRFKDTLGRS